MIKGWRVVIPLVALISLVNSVLLAEEAQVQIVAPADGAIVRGQVEVKAEGVGFRDLELIGVAVFEYSRDGEDYELIGIDNDSFDGFVAVWATTRIPDGEYKLRVTITDLWNTTALAEIGVWVDNERRLPRTLLVPQAFAAIQEAIAFARPGDTIQVDAGLAVEAFVGPISVNIPELVIESVNGEALIDGQGAEEVVRITGNSIVFAGFKVVNGGKGIALTGDNCTIADNTVSGNDYGIYVSGGKRNTVARNIAKNNDFMGILLTGADKNTLEGNVVKGNGADGGAFNAAGIALIFSFENLLEENVVQRNEGFFTSGILLRENSKGNILKNNVSEENSTGIELNNAHMNILEGNITTDNSTGIELFLADNNQLIKNFAENNSGTGLSLGGDDNEVEYNIVRENKTGISVDWFPGGNQILYNSVTDNEVGIDAEFSTSLFSNENTNVVHYNNIAGNDLGVLGPDEGILSATENWWGDPGGPYDADGDEEVPPCHDDPLEDKNADDIGDEVIGNVDYCPWLTTPVEIPTPTP